MGAEVLLMAKNKVDAIYDSDPNIYPKAQKFDFLTYQEALQRRLQVMDSTALALCMEHNMPIVVFNFFSPGTIKSILVGQSVGTLVAETAGQLSR